MLTTVAARPHTNRTGLTLRASPDAERERDLVERARRGDRDAFGDLVRMHLAAAVRVAMRVVRNADDAEDIVQDAFLSALANIDDFVPGRPFWPWLSRIVVNRAIDLTHANRVRRAEPIAAELPGSTASPLEETEQREFLGKVRRVIADMPPRQRLVVEMFDLEGASVAEIAALTGSAAATVRWHLHIARRALRKALLSDYGAKP